MFLTDRKLERRIAELKEHRYRDIINLNAFTVQEDTQGVVNPVLPEVFTGWDTSVSYTHLDVSKRQMEYCF